MAMTHRVELPDHVYQIAQQAAEKEGVTAEEWIVATVSRVGAPVLADDSSGERPLSEALAGFIGVIDSRTEPRHEPRRSAVGDVIAEKFRKQGIGPRHGNSD
jgi:hypothetical protein